MTGHEHVDVFRKSLDRCLADAWFIKSFYERFMASSAEVREKFKDTDMGRQYQMVTDSLYVLAEAADGGQDSPAGEALAGVAARHSRQGVDIHTGLYDLWTSALMEAASEHDPEFTPEVEQAWRQALAAGIEYMRSRY